MAASNYHVIEFIYHFEDRGYTCIPASWVLWVQPDHVVVAFPDEEPAVTDERVRNNQVYSHSWRMYRVRIIHSTDTYDGATNYISSQTINPPEESDQLDDITAQFSQSSISNHSREPEQGSPSRPSGSARGESEEPDINTTPRGKPEIIKKYFTSPVHDRNDTRWQFRYPEATEDTVELSAGTGVNIHRDAIASIARSTDYFILIRRVIEAVFTDEALDTCARTGAESPFHEYAGGNIRPPLDEQAQEIIFVFITEFGQQREWTPPVRKVIIKAINNRLDKNRRRNPE